MADLDQIQLPNGGTYSLKDTTQTRSDHRHYETDVTPLIHKTYASTSYYATTSSDYNTSSWYFMSIRPTSWYMPWTVKMKIHSFCPNYDSYESYTYSTISGRSDDFIYANWNERQNTAHYCQTLYRLKKAGYDAGYGHALGISIIYGDNYTNSNYYRTFEVDYYYCENCTVTILDTPVTWANWAGTGTTNYNSLSAINAVGRGLQESGDADSTGYNIRKIYSLIKAGSNKVFPYTFIMENSDGRWESIVTSNSTGTSKSRNTHGFKLGTIFFMGQSNTYNENAVLDNYRLWYMQSDLLDHRYSFNTANNSTNGTTANKPVYLVGTLNASDGLFYLDAKWWTQTLPTTADGKLYIYLGMAYDYYRMTFDLENPIYHYVNGAIREFTQDAGTVNGLTVQTAVPSGAKFTDTTYTLGTSGNNVTLTPSGGSAQSITVPYATSAGSATDSNALHKTGNETASGNKTLTGKTTLTPGSEFSIPSDNIITPNASSLIQSPIPKYLWHDLFAFCRATTPKYYTSANGTSWTEQTLEKRLFSHQEAWGSTEILNNSIKSAKWEWINGGFYASQASWLVLGITWRSVVAHFDLLLETSEDNGTTWTTLTSLTNLYYSAVPIWIKSGGTCQNSLRLTITKNAESATDAVLSFCAIRFLTSRWGDQGKGSEFEYPYTWDTNYNISPLSGAKFVGALQGNADTATSATKATQDESGNNIKATYANSFSISDHTITLKNKNGSSLGTVTVPDNNTTYTFVNGTNGFTVTPSGGSAQTVTVTPSIANNVTGSGTSGYIAKFNGGNTITNGPQLGSSTTTFLRNDGQWATPATGSDVNVTQTATSTSANYEVLFSATADNTTRTEGARKNNNLTFNPSTGNLQATQLNGVNIGSSPKFTDNNTTYTFANGTNGFTVTPSGGSAQTVTVTPSIANNVTGSGTSGYLTKFNGGNTITNGPQLGSDTTKFLRNDGTWAVPSSSGSSGNKIFITEPTPPYSVGDLWLIEDNNISVCVTARASGSFVEDDWGSAVGTLSEEELQSTIASAIAGAVTVVTGNSESGGNVIWRMNSNNVPYELLVTDTPDNITASTARIYRWDANGLRYSSTGYNGTYTTLINSSGQIPAQYLTGAINAGLVAIQNFTASMIHGGVLSRGRANNQDGTIELYDANGTLIAEVTNLGFKYYGPGTGSDRPYYLINTNGFVGYTKVDNVWTQTVKVAFDEFRMIKGYVRDELDIGSMIKIIPMTNGNNSGIAFVAST